MYFIVNDIHYHTSLNIINDLLNTFIFFFISFQSALKIQNRLILQTWNNVKKKTKPLKKNPKKKTQFIHKNQPKKKHQK